MNAMIKELLLQSLETELSGVELYSAAVRCAVVPELKVEWGKYLEQTETHVERLKNVCAALGMDANEQSPGRRVIRHLGECLGRAIQMARASGDAESAQLVAAECLLLAETKDHLNWELIGKLGERLEGEEQHALESAYVSVGEEEDRHLHHGKGWLRELWIQALGMHAMLPPPEEERDVTTAVAAARTDQARRKQR